MYFAIVIFTGWIGEFYRIIVAIRIHIYIQEAAAGLKISVRVQEPMRHRIVISCHQVIKLSFLVVIIPSITERVQISYVVLVGYPCTVCVLHALYLAPGIVLILCNQIAVAVIQADDVPAPVVRSVIGKILPVRRQAVLDRGKASVCVVIIVEGLFSPSTIIL